MAEKTTITLKDCMSGAFQALLKGDTKTRDELCASMERAFKHENADALPKDYEMTDKGNDA